METVFVKSESGVIFEMDIDPLDADGEPTTHARGRFEERIASGALTIIEGECVQVANWDGSGYNWVQVEETEAPKKGRGKKVEETEAPAE